jgi:Fe-S oxidoreductase
MDFLFYVGCVGSYDKRANEAVRALGALLAELGFSFGVLGDAENCDGNEVNMVGEKGLFQLLVEKNVQQFKALNIKKVIAFSPHAYNIFKNEYPKYGGNFEAIHYTQLLREIVKSGKLHFSKKLNVCVTYHDPCFLGRYNEEYNAPREVLKSIPGVKLIEMERNKQYSLCCGGGGGNFYTGYLNGRENSPNRIRVREAYETGAEILAVSCPICLIMLDDAVKSEGLEDKLIVQEISEIVKDAL